ncbi:hypothetical protein [Sinomonas mesophila]|uniref:hypothetical protein n=1 Tax=Sinomonas mesophila TaxID=1531955 RepID=UPI001115884C|nr:hypothetical protein [Sinomonas mesophila]
MSPPVESQALDRQSSPWTRPWFIASAAVVAVLVALGVLYAVLPAPGAEPAPATSPSASSTNTAQGDQDSACGLPTGDQRYPSVGLPTKWELLGRVAVPTDPKGIGPGRVDGNLRTCYQHSPTGALYAAANLVGLGFRPEGPKLIHKELMAESPERDRLMASPPAETPENPSLTMQIGGFKVASYSGDTAKITIGVKGTKAPSTVFYGSLSLALRWEDGDWKVMPEGATTMTQLQDLSDFVPWTGV